MTIMLTKKRTFRRRQRRAFVYGGLLVMCAALLLMMLGEVGKAPALREGDGGVKLVAEGDAGARLRVATNAAARRLYYPYSLVEGGVRDVSELRARVERDPMLAAHYAGFDLGRARMVRANEEKFVYVSYRLPGGIFWTSRKMHVVQGEMLITDGGQLVRARCGNFISERPREPVTAQEPSVQELDTPSETAEEAAKKAPPMREIEPLAWESNGTLTQPEPELSVSKAPADGDEGGGVLIPAGPSGDRPRKKKGSETPTVPAGGAMPGAGFLVVCGAALAGYLILKRN